MQYYAEMVNVYQSLLVEANKNQKNMGENKTYWACGHLVNINLRHGLKEYCGAAMHMYGHMRRTLAKNNKSTY